MLLDSLNHTTESFTALSRRSATRVFEALVLVGDRMAGLDCQHLPNPPPLLMARAYAETCLTFLRGKKSDIEVGEAERVFLIYVSTTSHG
jgi:hypothetical protein